MGSFIYNGFASNLPVEHGEDAVMFICIENNEYRCHNGHQPTRLKTLRLSSADIIARKEPSRGVLDISETCFAKGLKDSPYSFGRDSR